MSVFHVFYLESKNDNDFSKIKESVIELIPIVPEEIAGGRPQIYENTENLLSIWCEFFSLNVKNGGQHVRHRSEDYGMNFTYQFWFDIYTGSPNWLEKLLEFVGKIINIYYGDCVLEANGETPLVMRKNSIITIDDKKLHGAHKIPFNEMGLEYRETNFETV